MYRSNGEDPDGVEQHDNVALFHPQSQPQTQQATHFDLQEATLLMHYLDQVFPWQFPYYNRNSQLGNRGWLLSLLSKRGPSYHAAMSLSALHKGWQNGESRGFAANQKAFNYRAGALREMCQFLTEEKTEILRQDDAQLADFLACSTLLISFEVRRP